MMRQQGDSQKRFREILKAVSTGTFNENHWKDLEKRYTPFCLIPIEGAVEKLNDILFFQGPGKT